MPNELNPLRPVEQRLSGRGSTRKQVCSSQASCSGGKTRSKWPARSVEQRRETTLRLGREVEKGQHWRAGIPLVGSEARKHTHTHTHTYIHTHRPKGKGESGTGQRQTKRAVLETTPTWATQTENRHPVSHGVQAGEMEGAAAPLFPLARAAGEPRRRYVRRGAETPHRSWREGSRTDGRSDKAACLPYPVLPLLVIWTAAMRFSPYYARAILAAAHTTGLRAGTRGCGRRRKWHAHHSKIPSIQAHQANTGDGGAPALERLGRSVMRAPRHDSPVSAAIQGPEGHSRRRGSI